MSVEFRVEQQRVSNLSMNSALSSWLGVGDIYPLNFGLSEKSDRKSVFVLKFRSKYAKLGLINPYFGLIQGQNLSFEHSVGNSQLSGGKLEHPVPPYFFH